MSDSIAPTGASAGAATVSASTPLRTLHQAGRRARLAGGSGNAVVMPLVGRDEPLTQLDGTLGRSIEYQAPQLVTIFGAPGIGKTRVLDEWCKRARLAHPDALLVAVAAEPTETNRPFALLRRLLFARMGWSTEIAAGTTSVEEDARRWDSLRAELAIVFGDRRLAEILFVLAPFVGLSRGSIAPNAFLNALSAAGDGADGAGTDGDGIQARLGRTLLKRFFELDAGRRPLVLVVDDLHLADRESISVLDDLATNLVGTSVMVVASARSELLVRFAAWGQAAMDRLRIDLAPLSQPETERLLRELLSRVEKLPAVVVRQLCDHVAGTPAFVEQLIATFLERQIVYADGGSWRIDTERALDVNLSLTVEEAVNARLAELSFEERDLLEKAALLEGVFWTGAMVALERIDRPDDSPDDTRRAIEQRLDDLASLEYLLRIPSSTIPGESEFVFRHNLERELVARLVPPERARRYYRRVAQWLETKWSDLGVDLGVDQLEMKASYFERGGDDFRAAQSYRAAASQARFSFAHAQAATLYERSLKLLHVEDTLSRIDVLHGYGAVLMLLGRSSEAVPIFEEMLAAASAVDQIAKIGAAYGRLAQIRRERGEVDECSRMLALAKEYFRRCGDTRGVALVEDQLGRLALDRGDTDESWEHHQLALDLRRALDDARPVAVSLHQIAELHHVRGQFAEAEARHGEALALRRKHDDLLGVIQSLCGLAGVIRDRGEPQRGMNLLAEAEELSTRVASRADEITVLLRLAELALRLGKDSDADQRLRRAQSLLEGMQLVRLESDLGRIGAELALGSGDVGLAVRRARAAVVAGERSRALLTEAAAHRVLALALAASGAPENDVSSSFTAARVRYEAVGATYELRRTEELAALDAGETRRARRPTPPPPPPSAALGLGLMAKLPALDLDVKSQGKSKIPPKVPSK